MTFCGLRFAVSHEKPDAKGPCYQNMHIYLDSRALIKWPEYPAAAFARERGTRESDAAGFIPIHGVKVIISLPPYRT